MLRLASEASGSVTESGANKSRLDSAGGMNRNRNGDDSDHDTQSAGNKRSIRRSSSLELQCVIILSVRLASTPTKITISQTIGITQCEKHTSFPIKTRIHV